MQLEIEFCDFQQPLPPGMNEEQVDVLTEGISKDVEGGMMSLETFIARLRSGVFGDNVSVTFKVGRTHIKNAEILKGGEVPGLVNEGFQAITGEPMDYWIISHIRYVVSAENAPASSLLEGIGQ